MLINIMYGRYWAALRKRTQEAVFLLNWAKTRVAVPTVFLLRPKRASSIRRSDGRGEICSLCAESFKARGPLRVN